MKTKQIIILGIILGLLGTAVVIRRFQKPPKLKTEEFAPLDLSFDTTALGKIQVFKGKDEKLVELVKTGGSWSVANFFNARADRDKINLWIKKIQEAKGELRARDPALFADFSLGPDEAYRLNFLNQSGQSLLTLYLSPKRPSWNSVFLRTEGSKAVYLANADFFESMGVLDDPSKVKPKADWWVQSSLVDLKGASAEKLQTQKWIEGREVIKTSVLLTVEPADTTRKRWKYTRREVPFALDAEKVRQFVGSLPDYKASKVLDPKAKDYGFGKPQWQMKLGLEGGSEILITAGGQDPDTKAYYLQVSTEPVVYELPEYNFRSFDIDDSKFFAENPLLVNPDKTSKLVIHRPEKEWNFNPKKKKWEALTSYLNDLKGLPVPRFLFDSQEQKKVAKSIYWIEIQKEGEPPQYLEVGEIISPTASPKEYAARVRGDTQPFAISESFFQKLFENLDWLAEPRT